MGGSLTYRAEAFRVAVLGLNEITSLTYRSFAEFAEFLIIFYG